MPPNSRPSSAPYFKMAVPLIVILPGLLALGSCLQAGAGKRRRPGQHSYNEVLPLMLARYCGPGLLGLGITALIAGFMSGMAGNVSAFATVWTYDLYRPFFARPQPTPTTFDGPLVHDSGSSSASAPRIW